MSSSQSNSLESRPQFAETQPIQLEVVDPSETTNMYSNLLLKRIAGSISFLGSFVASWTHNAALQAAISDPDIDEVVESMKVEWTSVGRWLFALAAMSISLFTIDAQSLFKVDEFAQKAIAISTVATGLGILCNAWFLIQFRHLERRDFMHRARCMYGSYLFFSLSAKFPSLAVIVSLGSLMAFGGRIVCNILPALVIALGITLLIIIMGFRIIVSGVTLLCSIIPGCISVFGCIVRIGGVENRGNLPAPV